LLRALSTPRSSTFKWARKALIELRGFGNESLIGNPSLRGWSIGRLSPTYTADIDRWFAAKAATTVDFPGRTHLRLDRIANFHRFECPFQGTRWQGFVLGIPSVPANPPPFSGLLDLHDQSKREEWSPRLPWWLRPRNTLSCHAVQISPTI
jgi:hypothetical protein